MRKSLYKTIIKRLLRLNISFVGVHGCCGPAKNALEYVLKAKEGESMGVL